MLRLLAVCLLLVLPLLGLEASPNLLLFTNDGTFYRLDMQEKAVTWHSSLNFKLMSFQMQDPGDSNSAYFLPTLDGHFLYIDRKREVIVQRKEVQELLDICFEGKRDVRTKYFVYHKFQYYVLNTQNGTAQPLEKFIKARKVLQSVSEIPGKEPQEVILAISQKYLKELTFGLQIKWSAISSTINLISVQQFFDTPTMQAEVAKHQLYKFLSSGPKNLQIESRKGQSDQFQLESSSAIISILSYDLRKRKYVSHSVDMVDQHLLALEDKRSKESKLHSFQEIQSAYHRQSKPAANDGSKDAVDFSSHDHFPVNTDHISELDKSHQDGLLFCVNTFRNMKKIKDGISVQSDSSRIINSSTREHQKQPQEDLPPPTVPFSLIGAQPYIREKEQPVALIFSGVIFLIVLFAMYKFGVRQFLKELSRLDQKNQAKIDDLERKINMRATNNLDAGKFSINEEQPIRQTSQYELYPGRFLNQDVNVYKLTNEVFYGVQTKLKQLRSISAKGICKIHFYTDSDSINSINDEEGPIIIVQKNDACLSVKNVDEVMKNRKPRQSMKEILTSLAFICDEIEIDRFIMDSIIVEEKGLKIDIIPSILNYSSEKEKRVEVQFKSEEQSIKQEIGEKQKQQPQIKSPEIQEKESQQLRQDIINIFYFIATKGQQFRQSFFSEVKASNDKVPQPMLLPNEQDKEYSDPVFLLKDFLEFISTQEEGMSSARFLDSISEHPYLWESKQKMLFFTEFSNYVETHIEDDKLRKFQSTARRLGVIRLPWVRELHPAFTREINSHRKYDYGSIRDLIRVVRNKVSHFHELPRQVKGLLGKNPEQFVLYFLWKFPKLLPFMFVYSARKKWKMHSL